MADQLRPSRDPDGEVAPECFAGRRGGHGAGRTPIPVALERFDQRLGAYGAVAVALFVLAALEFGLEFRHFLRTGEVVLAKAATDPDYVIDSYSGLRLLRPSSQLNIGGKVNSNSWGLRGAEIAPSPKQGTRRVAVLGASTVFGTYAATDRHTPPGFIEEILNAKGGQQYEVINAGVPGLTATDQVRLLEKRLLGAGISDLIWYAGQNDVSCPRAAAPDKKLLDISWLLTYELADKNVNVAVTEARNRASPTLVTPVLNDDRFEQVLRDGIRAAKAAGVRVNLVTLATLYDKNLSLAENEKFGRAVLHFKPCLNAVSLVDAKERANAAIRRLAFDEGVGLVDAAVRLSGRPEYFADSTHFSVSGSRAFADLIASQRFSAGLP